jgi:hypothetical protein
MLVLPVVRAVARPPGEVIEAADGVPDAQVTVEVMSAMLESLYVPLAVNCCVNPLVTAGAAGVTAIDCNVAAVNVEVAFPPQPVTPARTKLNDMSTTDIDLILMTHSTCGSDIQCVIVRKLSNDEGESIFL